MLVLKDKIVVVTGAAGNLGAAIVKKFLQNGAIVCGLDHKQGRLQSINRQANGIQKFYSFENIDVTDRDAMLELAEKINEQVGQVDIIVNTVGGFMYGEMVHELSDKTWQTMMDLNVQSFLNTAAAFVPGMIAKGAGKVVAIGSRASLGGSAKSGAYGAAKGALLRLVESMAAELKPNNIQINCVLPGTIDTPENRQEMPNSDFSKWVKPEQVAEVIQFLSSARSNAITGAAIPVFG